MIKNLFLSLTLTLVSTSVWASQAVTCGNNQSKFQVSGYGTTISEALPESEGLKQAVKDCNEFVKEFGCAHGAKEVATGLKGTSLTTVSGYLITKNGFAISSAPGIANTVFHEIEGCLSGITLIWTDQVKNKKTENDFYTSLKSFADYIATALGRVGQMPPQN